ncbi:MAG: DNA cytosine methyltransferase [Promethearchaeota archaeon]
MSVHKTLVQSSHRNSSEMRILDLFSGAGGFSAGFRTNPSMSHLAVDIDEFALKTYQSNYPKAIALQEDIGQLHSTTLENLAGGRPDVVIASPPCEEFSRANPKSKTSAVDRVYGTGTARLLLDAIRIVGDLEPSVFVIENVGAILESGGSEIIRREFERVGVDHVHFNMIRAHKHGNPSKRLRVFISNIRLNLPRKTAPTVIDTIGDLPPLGTDALFAPGTEIPNHRIHPISDDKIKRVRRTRWGRGARIYRVRNRRMPNWVRLNPRQVATSINGLSRYIHPFEDRLLTVREHARLMSYPDSFVFTGPTDSQYNQVGESVPPILSSLIAKEVSSYLDRFN